MPLAMFTMRKELHDPLPSENSGLSLYTLGKYMYFWWLSGTMCLQGCLDIFWKSKNINRHVFFVSVLVYKSPVYEKKAFDLVCERLASIGYPQVM